MSTIGAPAGAPPSAISGAPAGTTGATGNGAPIGSGAPIGTGAPTGSGPGTAMGTPAISVTGAAAGPHESAAAAPPAAPAPPAAAPAPPAAAGTSPAKPCMHAAPPVVNGAATACGLNAIAAPHNPALATTLISSRSKIVITLNSSIRAQIFPKFDGAAEPHSRTEVVPRRPTQLFATGVEYGPCRAAPCPNGDVRSFEKGAGLEQRSADLQRSHAFAVSRLGAQADKWFPRSAHVDFATGGIPASGGGDVDVVVVAVSG